MQLAVHAFGRLDILVNNAGYGDIAPFEQLSPERFKAVMDANFYGVVNLTRAALPVMRKQKSGVILSVVRSAAALLAPATRLTTPPNGPSEDSPSRSREAAPFGVKLCALEPGGIRTNWGKRANQNMPELLPDYEPSVGAFANAYKSYWGNETAIPKGKRTRPALPTAINSRAHLLLGSDAVQHAAAAKPPAQPMQNAGTT